MAPNTAQDANLRGLPPNQQAEDIRAQRPSGGLATQSERVSLLTMVVLPYPPSLNHLWRRVGHRTLKSAEGRAYHERCATLVKLATGSPHTWQPTGRLCLSLRVRPPDRRKRDIDNTLKGLIDAVCAGWGVDDSTIDELHVWREPAVRGLPGQVIVCVTPARTDPTMSGPARALGQGGQ